MPHDSRSRRLFLKSAALAGASLHAHASPAADPRLPVIPFGGVEVTRLIIGSNPLYGYSHFNTILSSHMREWYTQDRRLDVLHRAERHGINTWQVHYSEQAVADLKRYRDEGGKMNWLLLGHGDFMNDLRQIPEVAKLKPIGIAHHGGVTDTRYRNAEMSKVRDFCKAVRDAGVRVGISCHNPAVIDYVESQDWDIDYYMTCLYRISRTPDECRAEFGEAPMGEPFFEKDPERMCKMIRQTRRTCFAFKLLAAGRSIERPVTVERAFRFALTNIKPGDAMIVGMYPRFTDEVKQNTELVRKLTAT